MASTVKWEGAQFTAHFNNGLTKNLRAAGRVLANGIKQTLSKPGRTVENVTTKTGKTRVKYGKKGGLQSAPGEAPRKQTGALFRSVRVRLVGSKYDKGTGKRSKSTAVRVTSRGFIFEEGTDSMAKRPYQSTTFQKLQGAIAGAMTKPIPPKTSKS